MHGCIGKWPIIKKVFLSFSCMLTWQNGKIAVVEAKYFWPGHNSISSHFTAKPINMNWITAMTGFVNESKETHKYFVQMFKFEIKTLHHSPPHWCWPLSLEVQNAQSYQRSLAAFRHSNLFNAILYTSCSRKQVVCKQWEAMVQIYPKNNLLSC